LFNRAKVEILAKLRKFSNSWDVTAFYWCMATHVSGELAAYIFRVVRK
jgi:hypothetical protein